MQPHTPFRRYIAALTVGGFITALLLFALPTYAAAHSGQANPTPTPTLTIPTPTPTPVPPTPVAITPTPTVQQPTSISDCPGAIPNATTPSIEFCSPRFKGNEEGPYGTHITLLGRNIPGSLTGLYLLQVAKGKSPPPSVHINNNNCTPSAQCFPVDNVQPPLSQIQKTQLFPLSFNWTIQGAAPNKDYYAVLTYLPQNHAGKTSDVPPAISPIGFTLLSSNAPCITISLDQNAKESCTISQNTQQVTVGSTMYIHGENWNSGGVSQTINVELNTCQQPPCPRGSQVLLTQSIPFNSDGTFTSSSVPLKRDLVGDYWITASNQVPNNIAKDGSPMKADEALTFGDKKLGDAGALHLNIVRPCIVVTLNDPASTTPPEQAPSNCAQSSSKPISVTAGASFYLQGFHWSLSDKHTMTVKITCDQRSKCAGQKLPQIGSFMLQENQQGYFWQRVKVPDDSTGTYTINVTEDALQYGSSLKVLITPPTATAPTNNILPLLALLPALVSLLLYIIMQRRRTVQTAAATRRMPGGPGPTTARSSLPPPVIRQQPGGRR